MTWCPSPLLVNDVSLLVHAIAIAGISIREMMGYSGGKSKQWVVGKWGWDPKGWYLFNSRQPQPYPYSYPKSTACIPLQVPPSIYIYMYNHTRTLMYIFISFTATLIYNMANPILLPGCTPYFNIQLNYIIIQLWFSFRYAACLPFLQGPLKIEIVHAN